MLASLGSRGDGQWEQKGACYCRCRLIDFPLVTSSRYCLTCPKLCFSAGFGDVCVCVCEGGGVARYVCCLPMGPCIYVGRMARARLVHIMCHTLQNTKYLRMDKF